MPLYGIEQARIKALLQGNPILRLPSMHVPTTLAHTQLTRCSLQARVKTLEAQLLEAQEKAEAAAHTSSAQVCACVTVRVCVHTCTHFDATAFNTGFMPQQVRCGVVDVRRGCRRRQRQPHTRPVPQVCFECASRPCVQNLAGCWVLGLAGARTSTSSVTCLRRLSIRFVHPLPPAHAPTRSLCLPTHSLTHSD